MCRAGGRRCPGQYDPVKREQINARRRAAYARKKAIERGEIIVETSPQGASTASGGSTITVGGAKAPSVTKTVDTTPYKNTVNTGKKFSEAQKSLPTVMNGVEVEGYSGNDLWNATDTEVTPTGMKGVFQTKNTGSLAGTYFSDTTVHGLLKEQEIKQSDAAEAFGFQEIPEDEPYVLKTSSKFYQEDFAQMGRHETQNLSDDERRGLRMFTGHHYEWINGALFGHKKIDDEQGMSKKPSFADVEKAAMHGKCPQDVLDFTTNHIDSAIDKGQKRQRIVYRSVAAHSSLFQKNGVTAEQWAEQKLEVGKEIVFDGYQSATPVPEGMRSFSSDNGLIYEILTPEGINVSSISSFSNEHEVLLPRNARYMVVDVKNNVEVHIDEYAQRQNTTVVRLVAINDKGEVLDGTNNTANNA